MYNKTKVNQYDIYGIFIKTWNSIKMASENLKINYNGIILITGGYQKQSGGFQWKYFNGDINNIKDISYKLHSKNYYEVYVYELNGNFIKKFRSLTEGGKWLAKIKNIEYKKKFITSISNNIKNKIKSAYGYIWKKV